MRVCGDVGVGLRGSVLARIARDTGLFLGSHLYPAGNADGPFLVRGSRGTAQGEAVRLHANLFGTHCGLLNSQYTPFIVFLLACNKK